MIISTKTHRFTISSHHEPKMVEMKRLSLKMSFISIDDHGFAFMSPGTGNHSRQPGDSKREENRINLDQVQTGTSTDMHPPEMPSWFSNHHPKDRVPNTCWRFTSGESEIFYYQKKFKIKVVQSIQGHHHDYPVQFDCSNVMTLSQSGETIHLQVEALLH